MLKDAEEGVHLGQRGTVRGSQVLNGGDAVGKFSLEIAWWQDDCCFRELLDVEGRLADRS